MELGPQLKTVSVSNVGTVIYGKESFKYYVSKLWNSLQTNLNEGLLELERSKVKNIITNHFFQSYMDTQ